MNAPAARACCIARGAHLARAVCEGTHQRGSRRPSLVEHAGSRPRPSTTRGPVSPSTMGGRGPLSRVPHPPSTVSYQQMAGSGLVSLLDVSGGGHVYGCGTGDLWTSEEWFGGSWHGQVGGLSNPEEGITQQGGGEVMKRWVTTLPLMAPTGTRSSQGEVPPPQRRRDPVDLPTPIDLSVVLCRLRDELPSFFDGHHSYGMYSEDVEFQGNFRLLQLQLNSVRGYRVLMLLSRWLCSALLSCPKLELLKITKEVEEGCVRARWRVVGSLRLLPFSEERTLVDAVSTFDVDTCGLINRHQIDQVMPSKETQMAANWLPQS